MDIDPTFTINKSIVTLIITIIVTFGNIISFIIFSRKTFWRISVSIYCRALALFDTINNSLSTLIYVYYIMYDFFILNYSDFIYALFSYGYYTLASIPGWFLVAFTIDSFFVHFVVRSRILYLGGNFIFYWDLESRLLILSFKWINKINWWMQKNIIYNQM